MIDAFLRDRFDENENTPLLRSVRAIADQHLGQCASGDLCTTCRVPHPCPTLRLLAWAFDDHPDFDRTWSVPKP